MTTYFFIGSGQLHVMWGHRLTTLDTSPAVHAYAENSIFHVHVVFKRPLWGFGAGFCSCLRFVKAHVLGLWSSRRGTC